MNKKLMWYIISIFTLCTVSTALAYKHNTVMFKYFDDSGLSTFGTQWTQYTDYVSEMDSHITPNMKKKDPANLAYLLSGLTSDYDAWSERILALSTHGSRGKFYGKADGEYAHHDNIVPSSSTAKIGMLWGCTYNPTNNYDGFVQNRNTFRKGLHVMAGCWDVCHLCDTVTNTTWNEIGDDVADDNMTIHDSWWDGHTIGDSRSYIIIWGSGKKSRGDCDNKAEDVKRGNVGDFNTYTWSEDYSPNGDYELCGYYGSAK